MLSPCQACERWPVSESHSHVCLQHPVRCDLLAFRLSQIDRRNVRRARCAAAARSCRKIRGAAAAHSQACSQRVDRSAFHKESLDGRAGKHPPRNAGSQERGFHIHPCTALPPAGQNCGAGKWAFRRRSFSVGEGYSPRQSDAVATKSAAMSARRRASASIEASCARWDCRCASITWISEPAPF